MATQTGCKLDAVVDRHGLDDALSHGETVDDHLLKRWKGTDGAKPDGYRTLTEWFNTNLLRAVYDEQGRDTTGTRVESDYDALTGDDAILRREVVDSLADDGIDAERVLDDMISWSTMRTHLNECLDGEKPEAEASTDWEKNTVKMSQEFAENKALDAISSLISKGDLEATAPVDVDIQVLVMCRECPTRLPFEAAVDRGFVCKDHE